MANKKKVTKTKVKKKQNVKVKMKKDNSKMYLIIGITLIAIAAVISVITFSFENTKLTCKKENNKDVAKSSEEPKVASEENKEGGNK